MNKAKKEIATVPKETIIAGKIVTLRDENVILDVHLAEFYEIETRVLKQAVRRNRVRFPADFMFELNHNETDYLVSQNVIPSRKHFGGAVPFAFTENGVAMLSGILNTKKAVEINIAIVRTFTIIRKALLLHKDVLLEIGSIKRQLSDHNEQILMIFEYLKQADESRQLQTGPDKRTRIGYKRNGEE
jgi:phage regulator Rha-like protein